MQLTSKGLTLPNAVKALQQQLLEQRTAVLKPTRFSVDLEPVDALDFLTGLGDLHLPHMAWGERNAQGRLVAMAGQALPPRHRQGTPEQLRALMGTAQPGLRAYVSYPFDANFSADAPAYCAAETRWLLPRVSCDGETLSVDLFPFDDPQAVLLQLGDMAACLSAKQNPASDAERPAIDKTAHWPDRNQWHGNVLQALDMIDGKALEKIVLARRTDCTLNQTVPSLQLFRELHAATPRCFHFYRRFDLGETFFGASPELLFRRRGTRFTTDVLAGTRPRGTNNSEDAALAAELLASKKDGREHDIVRTAILQGLHQLSRIVDAVTPAEVLQLASKQHIYSSISAELAPGVDDSTLLSSLHPTPAVGGYPSGNALAEIRRLEPFPRDWYAGPIGWIEAEGAEFAVGIRSAIARGKVLSLFAGAGIVEGSDPGREWDEVDNKIGDFLRILGS